MKDELGIILLIIHVILIISLSFWKETDKDYTWKM